MRARGRRLRVALVYEVSVGRAKLLHGDCLDAMRQMGANSVDSIVCDPPYALTSAKHRMSDPVVPRRGFMGHTWDSSVPGLEYWIEALRVAKPGAYLLAFGGDRTHHKLMTAIEEAGWELRQSCYWCFGQGFPKSYNVSKGFERAGRPDLAAQWVGWGTALKPAIEIVVVARKPLDGNTTNNVLKHGVGALNIDGARIATDERWVYNADKNGSTFHGEQGARIKQTAAKKGAPTLETNPGGRFPATLIHDGSEEARTLFPDQVSGSRGAGRHTVAGGGAVFGEYGEGELPEVAGSKGSASRFFKSCPMDEADLDAALLFYCAKAGRAEREAGCELLPEHQAADMAGRTSTLRLENKDGGTRTNPYIGKTSPSKNLHPCCKPIKLMRYLCRLVTPPGGLILDPFMGSGSTGRAAILEGFRFIGCEREKAYLVVAQARIQSVMAEARARFAAQP